MQALDLEQRLTKQASVTEQHLDLFFRTTSHAKMRNSTMQHLDQGEMTSLSHGTSSRGT